MVITPLLPTQPGRCTARRPRPCHAAGGTGTRLDRGAGWEDTPTGTLQELSRRSFMKRGCGLFWFCELALRFRPLVGVGRPSIHLSCP